MSTHPEEASRSTRIERQSGQDKRQECRCHLTISIMHSRSVHTMPELSDSKERHLQGVTNVLDELRDKFFRDVLDGLLLVKACGQHVHQIGSHEHRSP